MYYIIYKITNQIDGKFYIGSHKTSNLEDTYMGSGKYLKYAQAKYGIENFTKEILFVYDNPRSMYEKEAEIVNEDFLATENTYNLKVGGYGGWDYINSNLTSEFTIQRAKKGYQASKESMAVYSPVKEENVENWKANISKSLKGRPGTFKGKRHKDDTKNIVSQKAKERLKDSTKNSQYGTIWITNGIENKKIKKSDSIPEGWKRGRKV